MAPLAALAISIASKYIPELIGKALDSKKAEEVSSHLIGAVSEYTGMVVHDTAQLEKAFDKAGPEFFLKQRAQVIELAESRIADVQHARKFKNDEVNTKISYTVMWVNPFLIVLGIVALIYVTTSLELDGGLLATISAVLGGWLNQLYQERQQVMNFHFGSSLGSKLKQRS